jgi:hypothetical protein
MKYLNKNGEMNLTTMNPEMILKMIEKGIITSLSPYEIRAIEKQLAQESLIGKTHPLTKELIKEFGNEIKDLLNENGELDLSLMSPAQIIELSEKGLIPLSQQELQSV